MAWGTATLSAVLTVDANYEFITDGTDALILTLNPREAMSLVFNMDSAGTTDDLEIEVLQGHRMSNGNGLDGATAANDLEINTTSDGFSTDDELNGTYIVMTSGDERGEGRLITDSVAADDGVVLEHALSGIPSAAETYALYRFQVVATFLIDSAAIGADERHNGGVTILATGGQYIGIRARATGATDAHRVWLSYQKDGVSI